MAMTRKPYCSLDDVKAIADRRSATDDDLITTLISQAQDVVDAELGFSFQTDGTLASPATRSVNGNGGLQLLIPPCLSLSSVLIRTYLVSTDAATHLLVRSQTDVDITADVLLGPQRRLDAGLPGFLLERYTGDSFDLGRQNIILSGVFGYATIPLTIQRATARLAVHFLSQRDARYQDVVGDPQYGQMVFKQQIPADVCALIRRERGVVYRS